jgi:hypothetical protein
MSMSATFVSIQSAQLMQVANLRKTRGTMSCDLLKCILGGAETFGWFEKQVYNSACN